MLEAAIEARQKGLIKAIGITGHGSQVAATHRRSLARFDFDSVLLPYNFLTVQSDYYRQNFNALQSPCQERGAAVQTIKSLAYRHWMARERTAATWYQPLNDQPDIDLALAWALGREGTFVISTGDVALLPKFLDATERAESQPSDDDMTALVRRLEMEPLFV